MKFLCPNCKAKYQISDEKITGRTLKMDCRRCAHAIVIRGDKVSSEKVSSEKVSSEKVSSEKAAGDSVPAPADARSSSSALKQQRQSYAGPSPARGGSARAPIGGELRKVPSSPPPAHRPTALDQWHIAINDVPVGPMMRDEVARKIASGAVDKESLCWREGLEDWRPLKNVPELASLLRRAAPAAQKKQPPLPPPPARPMGGPAPGRPPTGRQPASRPSAAEANRPAARGNVVPIGGRGGSTAPQLDDLSEDFTDDEPTRVGAEFDFAKLEADARAKDDGTRGRDREARERDLREAREREARDREARDRDARDREARERHELDARHRAERERDQRAALAAREAEDDELAAPIGFAPTAQIAHGDAFDPFASEAARVGGASSPGAASAPAAVAMEAIPIERRQRAIPIGAWIAIAGAASFGVVLAIMVGTHFLTQPPPVAAVQPPAVPDRAPEPLLEEPDPTPIEEPVVEEPVEAPVEEPVEAAIDEPGTGTGRRGTGTAAPVEPRPAAGRNQPALDAETQARLARFAGSESDQAPNLDVPTSDSLPGQERGTATVTELSSDQVRTVVTRERASVQRCYETFARQSGQAPTLRLDVDVTVGASGTVTRAVSRGQGFGDVNECVERTVRRWRFPRTSTESRISIPFVFTGRE